jgi:hypothetical protein
MLAEMQHAFRAAVLNGERAPAAAYVRADGDIAAQARVGVHANTVQASLASVLAAAYPALERLLGADNFRLLARAFVAAHPPRRPQLSAYGAEMAAFVGRFAHTADYPFLADLARLEWARNEALFAADAAVLTGRGLEGVAPEAMGALSLPWHPATRLVESAYAIDRLWHAERLARGVAAGAQTVLVTRGPDGAVQHREIAAGDAVLLHAFAAGRSLNEAAAAALAAQPDLDLQAALAAHLTGATFGLPDRIPPEATLPDRMAPQRGSPS